MSFSQLLPSISGSTGGQLFASSRPRPTSTSPLGKNSTPAHSSSPPSLALLRVSCWSLLYSLRPDSSVRLDRVDAPRTSLTSLLAGPSYWDQGILTVTGLKSHIPSFLPVKDLPLNECFLVFSAVGLVFNIIASTQNVYGSLPAKGKSIASLAKPLSRLLPYTLHTTAMITWLAARPAEVLHTTLLLPFMCFWGVAFAHHVQLLILSHLTASPFPAWWKHPLLILSMLGSLDANLPRFGRDSIVQTNTESIKWAILGALGLAIAVYSHFVWEVCWACFSPSIYSPCSCSLSPR